MPGNRLHARTARAPDRREREFGWCATAAEAIELVNLSKPELLFLDIRMPDMDGFDVVHALSANANGLLPQIITAYDKYAVQAFDIYAIDYLLKPFTPERLMEAVQRVRERLASKKTDTIEPNAEQNGAAYTTRMVFKSRGRILFLPVEDIRWIEAEENYVRVCAGGESHLLREAIGHMETRLDPQTFLRVHRSFIVNLRYVKEVKSEPDGDATVVMVTGEKIAMSRSYRSRIQKLMKV